VDAAILTLPVRPALARGHPVAAEPGQLVEGETPACRQDDDGVHPLAPGVVRDADDGRVATAGCWQSAFSTSTERTFSPPVMITSLIRSTRKTWPSSSSRPPSPVCIQPPRNASAVSSGRSQ
jgi:hypothetical protein